ncbi:MAG: glycosyltransferase [Candidatus Diapherotrites archaeon]|nr:glycosyltransferase [Candidatus Diapherotrites archaeon]
MVYGFASIMFDVFFWIALAISAFYMILFVFTLLFRTHINEKEPVFIESKTLFVSVHIPTRNELVAISCAKACLEFDYPQNKFEILIGDDSDQPEVSKKLAEFAQQHSSRVRVIQRAKNIGFKAGNLNNLIPFSRGEIFVIFDSDFIPKKDFLKRIIAPFLYDSKLAAVQARWKPKNSGQNIISILAANVVEVFHYVMIPFMRWVTGTVVICGSAEAVRKSYLIQYGNWQNGSLTEDIEYSFRLIQAGHTITYLENLECECEVPFNAKDLYRQQMRWAYGVMSAFRQHFIGTMLSKIPFNRKFSLGLASIGYLLTVILEILFVVGFLKLSGVFIFPAQHILVLFLQTLFYVLLTIGPILVAVLVLFITQKADQIYKFLLSTFSYGILTIYYVNVGIYKALFNKPMQWFLVAKSGNTLAEKKN